MRSCGTPPACNRAATDGENENRGSHAPPHCFKASSEAARHFAAFSTTSSDATWATLLRQATKAISATPSSVPFSITQSIARPLANAIVKATCTGEGGNVRTDSKRAEVRVRETSVRIPSPTEPAPFSKATRAPGSRRSTFKACQESPSLNATSCVSLRSTSMKKRCISSGSNQISRAANLGPAVEAYLNRSFAFSKKLLW